ncbi:hypothetical protein KIN20_022005, partial [Parelaphostrongylus tenuis]
VVANRSDPHGDTRIASTTSATPWRIVKASKLRYGRSPNSAGLPQFMLANDIDIDHLR